MGFLTTFTILNDGLDEILKNSDDFCQKLYYAALGGKTTDIAHGHHGNLVKVQRTRHADDNTLYVHMENSLYEMSASSMETEELMRNHPEFFRQMLNYMKRQVGGLEKQFKEYQANPKP
jgi:hypothetical protein